MFDSLTSRITEALKHITGKGSLREADLNATLNELRRGLVEADVSLSVVRTLLEKVKSTALGTEIISGLKPSDIVIKAMHDAMVETLGDAAAITTAKKAPTIILLVGLQGSGKTTTAAKLALWQQKQNSQKTLLASLDTTRPAAQEQLRLLGEQNSIETLPIIADQDAVTIAKRALAAAKFGKFDQVILDTAGRGHTDDALMEEIKKIYSTAKPHEILLVADAMTGQNAARIAEEFNAATQLTGVIMTRMDADARGGAVLSMRAVTGVPIKFIGVGEKIDGLEIFYPDRVARRILGQGDIVSLVEKIATEIDHKKAEKAAKRLQSGSFNLNDLADQFRNMNKMGGLKSIASMLPGMGKMADTMEKQERTIARQLAIIQSMTGKEKLNPQLFNASRKNRVAKGAGVQIYEVNKLLKTHQQFSNVMKRASSGMGDLPAAPDPNMAGMAANAALTGNSPFGGSGGLGAGGIGGGLGGLGLGGGGLPSGGAGIPGLGGISKRRAAKALKKKPKRRK